MLFLDSIHVDGILNKLVSACNEFASICVISYPYSSTSNVHCLRIHIC